MRHSTYNGTPQYLAVSQGRRKWELKEWCHCALGPHWHFIATFPSRTALETHLALLRVEALLERLESAL